MTLDSQTTTAVCIPRALCGSHQAVRREWRAITKRALKSRDWEAALAGQDYISVDASPGDLILGGPSPVILGKNVLLYVVLDELSNLCMHLSADLRYSLRREMFLNGLDLFWFALANLASQSGPFARPGAASAEERAFARKVLEKMLRWWPTLCGLEGRFSLGFALPRAWPLWAARVFRYGQDAGMSDAEIDHFRGMPPSWAGTAIRNWLASWDEGNEPIR
jgi:hypothetical protein